jgi:hypothetical protein
VSNISKDLVDAENPRCKVKLTLPNGNEIELGNSADTYSGKVPDGFDTSSIDMAPQQLSGTEVMDIVACHRLDVKGLYVLNVTVSYEDPRYGPRGAENRRRAFKKIFKFTAIDALETIKARCTELKDVHLLQVSFRNLLPDSELCVENVLLKEQNGTIVSPIESILNGIRGEKKSNILDVDTICQNLLSPQAVRHVVIRIDKKDTPRIASIVVVWRSEGGRPGFVTIPFENVSLKSSSSSASTNTVSVAVFTNEVLRMGKPSTLSVQVMNRTNRDVSLQLTLREKYALGLTFMGLTRKTLGTFASGESKTFPVVVLPEHCGLLNLKQDAVIISELSSGERYNLSEGMRIWVKDCEDEVDE